MGLLLLRLAAGIGAIAEGVAQLHTELATGAMVVDLVSIGAGIVLLVGLWTPISGSMVGLFAIWEAISQASEVRACVLLSTIGIALALLGPGIWSVDARLFGWKRIDLHGDR